MMRLLLIPGVLVVLTAASLFWSGVTGTATRADFTFVNRGDNKCLDPNGMSWMQDIRLSGALWEGLFVVDPATNKTELGCADRAELDEKTHTVWTIHIRKDARWSNGDPVTAGDFLFAWRRFLETPGEYSSLHHLIRGAEAYENAIAEYSKARHAGDSSAKWPSFAGVGEVALDDHTLRVTLVDPTPFFPDLLAFAPFFPMHQASMKAFEQVDPATGIVSYDQAFTRPPNLVSNGAYRLAEWSFKRRLRLVKSDYYWDRVHVKSATIDQVYGEDPLAAYRLYDNGLTDWLSDVDFDLAANMLARGGRDDLHVFPAFGTYYYCLNCSAKLPGGRANPLLDVRVRQALAMSIDKAAIVKEVGRLNQPVASEFVPPNVLPGYVSPKGLAYDPEAARKLFAAAGYAGGAGFPRISILFNSEGNHGDIAQMVRHQWQTELGITVDLESVEVKVFGARLHTQDYDIARSSWYGDYDDPTTFTDLFITGASDNNAKYSNPKYDALCAAARKEPDAKKRLAILAQAEQLLLQDAPIIPLYHPVNAYLYRSNVRGIPMSPRAMIDFKSVEVVR